jgi:MoaA/NifB/PqqE/SkfB family radical SAM enzyme
MLKLELSKDKEGNEKAFFDLYVILGNKCPVVCNHCWVNGNPQGSFLDLNLLENIDIPINQVVLSGGEPFTNIDQLIEAVELFKQKEAKKIFVQTTGFWAVNPEITKLVFESLADETEFYIEHTGTNPHTIISALNNGKESQDFEYIINGAHNIVNYLSSKYPDHIIDNPNRHHTRCTPQFLKNLDSVKEIGRLISKGWTFHELPKQLFGQGFDKSYFKVYPQGRALSNIHPSFYTYPATCRQEIIITHKGDVLPCGLFPYSLGNLGDRSLKNILKSRFGKEGNMKELIRGRGFPDFAETNGIDLTNQPPCQVCVSYFSNEGFANPFPDRCK